MLRLKNVGMQILMMKHIGDTMQSSTRTEDLIGLKVSHNINSQKETTNQFLLDYHKTNIEYRIYEWIHTITPLQNNISDSNWNLNIHDRDTHNKLDCMCKVGN